VKIYSEKKLSKLESTASEAETEKNYKKSFSINYMLARNKVASSMWEIGRMCGNSEFLRQDLNKALIWEVNANLKDNSYLSNIAVTYRQMGNLQASKYILYQALKEGEDEAALDLAKLYNISKKEHKRVRELLNVVLNSENVSEYALEESRYILKNIDLKRNIAKTHVRLGKPIKLNNKIFEKLIGAEINFNLENYKKACKQFRKLANENKSYIAMDYLGKMYQYGLGVEANYKISMFWYKKAIRSGGIDSLINLAFLYRDTQKIDLYFAYLKQAQKHGSDRATLFLAKLYNISAKEDRRVKKLLKQVLKSKTSTIDLIYEAKTLLKQLQKNS
jgi:TPR repeat protein